MSNLSKKYAISCIFINFVVILHFQFDKRMKRTTLYFSALMLALTVRLYKKFHTLNLDEIYEQCNKEEDED